MGFPKPMRLDPTEWTRCRCCGRRFLAMGPADVYCSESCTPEYGWEYDYSDQERRDIERLTIWMEARDE